MRFLQEAFGLNGEAFSPFWKNIVVSQIMLLYYKVGCELIFSSNWKPSSRRQAMHMLLSSCIMFWPLFEVQAEKDWSWRLNTLVPSVMVARLYYKGSIRKDPNDTEVQTISRSSSPSELLWGPLQWAAVLTFLGLYHFRSAESAIIVAAVGVGDALAPWFGTWYGRHVYQMPWSGRKTMEGSVVGVFLGTCVGIYLCLWLMGLQLLPLRVVLIYGLIAAIAEGISPGHADNLTVPLAIHFLGKSGIWGEMLT